MRRKPADPDRQDVYVRIIPPFYGTRSTRSLSEQVTVDYLNGELSGIEILDASAVEVNGRDIAARRLWWYPASTLTNHWLPFIRGGDEYGNRTIGVRLPGGMLIIALNVPLRRKLWDQEIEPTNEERPDVR